MTTFDKRKEGMEGRFAHDEEMKFKATARRDKTFGTFIAELLGKTGDDVSAYALEVIKSNMAQPGDEDMFAKVRGDIDAAGVDFSDHLMRKKAEELMNAAFESVSRGD